MAQPRGQNLWVQEELLQVGTLWGRGSLAPPFWPAALGKEILCQPSGVGSAPAPTPCVR